MVIVDWLLANPDAAALVVSTVTGLFIKKKKTDALAVLKDKALAHLRRELFALVDEHATVEKARKHLENAADLLLGELKVKRTKLVDALLEPLIEQALKEYQERLGPILLKMRIDELFGAVSKLPEAFGGTKLEDSEAAFRAASNVEVVTEMPK